MNFVQKHKSLAELYAELLITKRQFEVADAKGESKCLHCSRQKSVHLGDGRYSIAATSRTFRDERQPDIDRVNRALDLIEELQGL